MRRAPTLALGLAAALPTVLPAAVASADPAGPAWRTTSGSYYAVGQGGAAALEAGPTGGLYSASGIDARGLAEDGHGGFVRFEQGRLREPTVLAADPYVLALDLGYAYGVPLLGAWGEQGVLGFFEVGLSGWQRHAPGSTTLSGSSEVLTTSSSGFGFAFGASVEARYGPARFGIALQRREIPMFVGGIESGRRTSSMTLQVRLGAEL